MILSLRNRERDSDCASSRTQLPSLLPERLTDFFPTPGPNTPTLGLSQVGDGGTGETCLAGRILLFWSILGLPVAAIACLILLRGKVGPEFRQMTRSWPTYLWLALTTGIMQAATLFTFGQLQVGYSLALFQLSTLISVFLGYHYFAELNIRRRLIGSAIMVVGAGMIVALGR